MTRLILTILGLTLALPAGAWFGYKQVSPIQPMTMSTNTYTVTDGSGQYTPMNVTETTTGNYHSYNLMGGYPINGTGYGVPMTPMPSYSDLGTGLMNPGF
jgi:hypothetical protein